MPISRLVAALDEFVSAGLSVSVAHSLVEIGLRNTEDLCQTPWGELRQRLQAVRGVGETRILQIRAVRDAIRRAQPHLRAR